MRMADDVNFYVIDKTEYSKRRRFFLRDKPVFKFDCQFIYDIGIFKGAV